MLFETTTEGSSKTKSNGSPTTVLVPPAVRQPAADTMSEQTDQRRHEVCYHDGSAVQCRHYVCVKESSVENYTRQCLLKSKLNRNGLKVSRQSSPNSLETVVAGHSCKYNDIRTLDNTAECIHAGSFKLVQRTSGATTTSHHRKYLNYKKQGSALQSHRQPQTSLQSHSTQETSTNSQKSQLHNKTTLLHNRLLVALFFLLAIFSTSFAADTATSVASNPLRLESLETVDLKSIESVLEEHREMNIPDLVAFASRLFQYQLPEGIFGEGNWRYQANEAGRNLLPAWLHLDEFSGQFSAVPLPKDIGQYYISLEAYPILEDGTTSGHAQSGLFSIEVKPFPEQQPVVDKDLNSIPDSPDPILGYSKLHTQFSRTDFTPIPQVSDSSHVQHEDSIDSMQLECTVFPSQCQPHQTPTLTNFLFLAQFQHLSSLERVNLVVLTSELLGVCAEQIFIRDIDWSSKEGLVLWRQLADANFPYIHEYSTVLSFIMSCEYVSESDEEFETNVSIFERSLPICQEGLTISDEESVPEGSVDCYTWFITRGAELIFSSGAESREPEPTIVRRRRVADEDGPDPVEIVANPTVVVVESQSTLSSFLNPRQTSLSGTDTASVASQISPTTTQMTDVILTVPPTRVVPSSQLQAFTQHTSFVPPSSALAAVNNTSSRIQTSPSSSIAVSKPVGPVSSVEFIESFSTFIQVIDSPTPTPTPSQFSIRSTIDVLSSPIQTSTAVLRTSEPSFSSLVVTPSTTEIIIIPMSSLTSDMLVPLSTLVPTPSPSMFIPDTSVDVMSRVSPTVTDIFEPFTSATAVIDFFTSTPQLIPTSTVVASSVETQTLSTSVVPSFISIEPTPIPSSSFIDFFMPSTSSIPIFIETPSPSVFISPAPTSAVVSTSSNVRIMPLPSSELTLSVSFFTPDLTPTSSPVFTSEVSFSISLSMPAVTTTPIVLPSPSVTSRMVSDFFTPSFSQRSFSSQITSVMTPPVPSPTQTTPAVETTPGLELSTSMDFFTSSTVDMFLSLEPTPSLTETPSQTSLVDVPLTTSEFFFVSTSDVLFSPTPSSILPVTSPLLFTTAAGPSTTIESSSMFSPPDFTSSSFVSTFVPSVISSSSPTTTAVLFSTPAATTTSPPIPTPSFSLETTSVFDSSSSVLATVTTQIVPETSDIFFPDPTSSMLGPTSSIPQASPTPSSSSAVFSSSSMFPTLITSSDIFIEPFPTTTDIFIEPTTTILQPEPTTQLLMPSLSTPISTSSASPITFSSVIIPTSTPTLSPSSTLIQESTPLMRSTAVPVPTPSFGVISTSTLVDSTSSVASLLPSLTFEVDLTTTIVEVVTLTPSMSLAFSVPSSVDIIGPLTTTVLVPEPTTSSVDIIIPFTSTVPIPEPTTSLIDIIVPFTSTVLIPEPTTSLIDIIVPFTSSVLVPDMTTSVLMPFVTSTSLFPSPTPSPTPIPVCEFIDCNNGTCIDLGTDFMCDCFPGWTGEFCDVDIDFCTPPPLGSCDVNGTVDCVDGNTTYTCLCALGFTGENCSVDIDNCVGMPCLNGATCVDGLNQFTCMCGEGFTGSFCDIKIDPCNPNPCNDSEECIVLGPSVSDFACMPLPMTTIMTSSSSFTTSTGAVVTMTTTMIPSSSVAITSIIPSTSVELTTSIVPTLTPTPLTTPTPTPLTTPTPTPLTTPTLKPITTPTVAPNASPMLLNPIGMLTVNEGQLFQFVVPELTFIDPDGGSTNNLNLSLLDSNGNLLPDTIWVQLSVGSPNFIIEGIPLREHLVVNTVTDYTFLLRAEDRLGASAHDFVTIRIFPQENPPVTLLRVFFVGNFTIFDRRLSSKINLVTGLASHLTSEPNTDIIYVDSFQSGSIAVTYHNLTVSDTNCTVFQEWVATIFNGSSYTETFMQALLPFEPTSSPVIIGFCNDTLEATPPQIDPTRTSNLVLLLATLIPILSLALLCLLLGFAALILYRRRRREREELVDIYPNEEDIFLRRRPIILPGDLDLPARRRRPVILPNDLLDINRPAVGAEVRRPLLEEVDAGDDNDSSDDEEVMPFGGVGAGRHHPIGDPPPYRLPHLRIL